MADTSIRVPVEVRDRLAVLAADEGVSIGELVARLSAEKRTEDEAAARAKQAYDYIREHLVPDFGPDDIAAGQAYMDEVRRRAAEHYARREAGAA